MIGGREIIKAKVGAGEVDMTQLSRAAGKNPAYIQQFLTRNTPRELPELVREAIAPLLGVQPDALREGPKAAGITYRPPQPNARPALDAKPFPDRLEMPRDVPVLGTAAGSDGDGCFELNQGDPVDYVRRGPGIMLSRQVFCIYVEGESMSPWKEPGELVYLDPARPVRVGDYVVLVMDGDEPGSPPQAYLKRLVRRSPTITVVRQYNPDLELEFETRLIKKMTRVLTMEEVMGV